MSYLKIGTFDGTESWEQRGRSISMNDTGTIIAVGSNENSNYDGSVDVLEWKLDGVTDTWQQKGTTIVGTTSSEYLGSATSLNADGNVLAVGSKGTDSVAVYEWDGAGWSIKGAAIVSNDTSNTFGTSISLNDQGNILVISSVTFTEVYEWRLDGLTDSWQQKGIRIEFGVSNSYTQGSDINADGTIVAIGLSTAMSESHANGNVQIFEWRLDGLTDSWQQKGTTIIGDGWRDNFGISVSLSSSGDIIAVGAPNDDDGGSNAGHIRVYEWRLDGQTDSWQQKGHDIDGLNAYDNAGFSVSLSSDGAIVAAGAMGYDNPPAANSDNTGIILIYEWGLDGSSDSWQEKSQILGESPGDRLGMVSTMNGSGTIIAGGSTQNTSYTGIARVYSENGSLPSSSSGSSNTSAASVGDPYIICF